MKDLITKLMRKGALERPLFADAEKKYNDGDKSQLILTRWVSDFVGTATPQWAQNAFVRTVCEQPVESWDDVFEAPTEGKPKKRWATARRHAKLLVPIYANVQVLVAQDRAIEPDLFDEIGNKLGVSGRTASRVYYEGAPYFEPIMNLLRRGLTGVYGEKVATLTMRTLFVYLQDQTPEGAFNDGLKAMELLKSNRPSKYEEMLELGAKGAAPNLSEIIKSLTKTP
jgi:hypothetical protein